MASLAHGTLPRRDLSRFIEMRLETLLAEVYPYAAASTINLRSGGSLVGARLILSVIIAARLAELGLAVLVIDLLLHDLAGAGVDLDVCVLVLRSRIVFLWLLRGSTMDGVFPAVVKLWVLSAQAVV
mmetsp:Transcript_17452/g.23537  ORF Transcript_17452/g.23537 Transcript_17452/m.23537 type:complete len:127 (+) Transcript_17452:859-1239(+)